MNINNATVVEFLSLTNPSLIREWNAHVGIESLKQLANEYGEQQESAEIEQKISLIDERLVFAFLDSFADADIEPDLFFGFEAFESGINSTADFFDRDSDIIKTDLLKMWHDTKEFFPVEFLDKYDNMAVA